MGGSLRNRLGLLSTWLVTFSIFDTALLIEVKDGSALRARGADCPRGKTVNEYACKVASAV